MRKIFTLVAAVIITSAAQATTRTVSNFPANVAQFGTIDAAIGGSSDGDTILVHGSPNGYGAFTLNKRLTIIGPGWSPNKQQPFTASVSGMSFSTTASNGSEIQGLIFTSTIQFSSNENVSNISFVRNLFSNLSIDFSCCGISTHSNFLFEGNFFDNAGLTARPEQNYSNWIFQNNYFVENGCCRGGNFQGFTNVSGFLIDHNLFVGSGSGTRDVFSNATNTNNRFMLITNNIFVRRNAATGLTNSTFNNNITFQAGTNNPWAVNSNSDGGGNVEDQSPGMVDESSVDGGTINPLLNFTIASGVANNAGSDGKDMGLLFDGTGSLNWNNSRMARLPFINTMNITTPTVAPGGNVQVNVQAKTNN